MIRVEDNLYNATFPQQKVPLSKKNEKWQHDCVNYIIGEGNVVSGGMDKTRFSILIWQNEVSPNITGQSTISS